MKRGYGREMARDQCQSVNGKILYLPKTSDCVLKVV